MGTKYEQPSDVRIDYTVMALREYLMEYFKEMRIDHFVNRGYIDITDVNERVRYRYEREQMARNGKKKYSLRGIELFTVQKEPMKITYCRATTKLDPAFKYLIEEVDSFMKEYLKVVERGYDANDNK